MRDHTDTGHRSIAANPHQGSNIATVAIPRSHWDDDPHSAATESHAIALAHLAQAEQWRIAGDGKGVIHQLIIVGPEGEYL